MINPDLLKEIRSGEATTNPERKIFSQLDTLDLGELLELRSHIDQRLPATQLNQMNLEEELVRQYLTVQAMQTFALNDDNTPANQKAQVANSVAGTLQALVRMQSEFHTAERFKAIENLMIKHFKRLPLDHVERFLEEYEAIGVTQ